MNHSAHLHASSPEHRDQILHFTANIMKAIHNTFRYGQGTKDMSGEQGLTTEQFVDKVAWSLGRYVAAEEENMTPKDMLVPSSEFRRNYNVDRAALEQLFSEYDSDKTGAITIDALELMLEKIGVAPMKDPFLRSSASKDKQKTTKEE